MAGRFVVGRGGVCAVVEDFDCSGAIVNATDEPAGFERFQQMMDAGWPGKADGFCHIGERRGDFLRRESRRQEVEERFLTAGEHR